jgi:hypothetical protein
MERAGTHTKNWMSWTQEALIKGRSKSVCTAMLLLNVYKVCGPRGKFIAVEHDFLSSFKLDPFVGEALRKISF